MIDEQTRVLAIASGGGHWVQLLRLRPAFADCELTYASSRAVRPAEVGEAPYYRIPEANRDTPVRLFRAAVDIFVILCKYRPHVVVTTGAAPGAIAVLAGKALGARTIWIDSIANVERISMSGRVVRPFADLWLTQWEHLAQPRGPRWVGATV